MSTEVTVAALPLCDIHRGESDDSTVLAVYDGKTRWGPWANMCEHCWNHYGVGLGTGKGQRLVLTKAAPIRGWEPSS